MKFYFQLRLFSGRITLGDYLYYHGLGDSLLKFQPVGIDANTLSAESFKAAEEKKAEEAANDAANLGENSAAGGTGGDGDDNKNDKNSDKKKDKDKNSVTKNRVKPRKATLDEVTENQPRDENGNMIDPNTKKPLKEGEIDLATNQGRNGEFERQCTRYRVLRERKFLMRRTMQTFISGKIALQIGVINMNRNSKDPRAQYFDYVEDIAGKNGKFFKMGKDRESVVVAAYESVPEEGCLTAFSFGLSSEVHPEWIASRPELVLSVNSSDYAWAIAMGEVVQNGRDNNLFSYGSILNFGTPISGESSMSAFLVFACNILEKEDLEIELADRTVHISQVYPIYKEEIPLIKRVGAEFFFTKLEIDFFDTRINVATLN